MGAEQHVIDPTDARLRDYRDLTDAALRRVVEPEQGLFIAEGEKVIRRALAAGYRPRSFLMEPRWLATLADVLATAAVPVLVAEQAVLEAVTGYRVHRGALASMQRKPLPAAASLLAAARRVVVLEGIVDHTNVGAVFRSAAALGFDAVLVDPGCADPLYRRSVRVSMGSVLWMPWTRLSPWPAALDRLVEVGFVVAALSPRADAVDLATFATSAPERVALALGTEGDGLTDEAMDRCSLAVRIPMARGIDSLNVGAAAAVACYALSPTAP